MQDPPSRLRTAIALLALWIGVASSCSRPDGLEARVSAHRAEEEQEPAPDGAARGRRRGDGQTGADRWARHLEALRKKIPARGGFTVVVEKPFVVIGDESPELVRRRAAHTVRWAVTHLKTSYFEKDPERIIDIWLFRNKRSYRKHTREIFRDDPDTPFGYYSASDHALIMNIATGGGTLCHEIVHAFMDPNFPACPAWFNEGLASLYEQCGERGGRIVGFTNWRLAGLQKAIREKRLPTFRKLTSTSTHEFYEEDRGTHYAQARYLCYYLQEKGLLRKYYRAFRAGATEDPTGYDTLVRVLGERDMAAFQARWQAWVCGLRFS